MVALFFFAGKSGVGKLTAARLLMEDGYFALLGDDMLPLSRGESGWLAHASPLGGDIPPLPDTSSPSNGAEIGRGKVDNAGQASEYSRNLTWMIIIKRKYAG